MGRATGSGGAALARNAGWIAAGVLAVVVVIVVAVRPGSDLPTNLPIGSPVPTAPPIVRAPDISNLTPRQRADRLFDRILTANEAGFPDTVAFFTPMALDAYRLLGGLDPDARYHVGLIHALAGNVASVAAQLDTLKTQTPDHLFGFMLEYAYANLTSDEAAMEAAHREFLAAYDGEIADSLPEYALHQRALDAFRAEALAR